jgi:hypothetical protein
LLIFLFQSEKTYNEVVFSDYLKINPIPVLLDFNDPALKFFVERDLLQNKTSLSKPSRCDLPECSRIVNNQLENGSGKTKGIDRAIQWLLDNQSPDGFWHACIGHKEQANGWVTLAVCRILNHYL